MIHLHYKIDDDTSETRVIPLSKVYACQRSRYCQFVIAENREIGKFLAIDGRIQSSEYDYMDYHTKLLENVPIRDKPGKALVLGAGEGVTGALLSSYGYEVDAVDVDGVLIRQIEMHMGDWIRQIKTPNRITTYIYDAVDYLEHLVDEDKKYDVVVFDLTEPNVASEECYKKDFLNRIKNVLTPNGLFVFQAGSVHQDEYVLTELMSDGMVNEIQTSVSDIAEWVFGTTTFKGE